MVADPVRLRYLQNKFVPTATKLIADLGMELARLQGNVSWRVDEINRIADELRAISRRLRQWRTGGL